MPALRALRRALARIIGTPRRCASTSKPGQTSVSISTPSAGWKCVEEARDDERRVVGQPGLHVAVAQQRAAGVAPGRRAVRQQQAHARARRAQRRDQRRRGARLAERDGVDPEAARPEACPR